MGLAVNNQNVKCQQQKNKTNQRHPSPAWNREINKIAFIRYLRNQEHYFIILGHECSA